MYWQMVACVHDHVGQKRRVYVHDQAGGWGERRRIYPRPRQVKSCHVTTPIIAMCAAALQNILTKQSKHMYLLTKLSASQTAAWHGYFRIHHTYKSILIIVKERHVGPLLKSEKSCSMWHASRCRPLGAVPKGLFLISCVQFNTATPKPVWLVCWRPRWHPRGPSVEVAHAMESSISVNCLMKGCPSWRAVHAQHAVILLPDPRHAVRGRLSSPTSK